MADVQGWRMLGAAGGVGAATLVLTLVLWTAAWHLRAAWLPALAASDSRGSSGRGWRWRRPWHTWRLRRPWRAWRLRRRWRRRQA
jgi:hypothetical protein